LVGPSNRELHELAAPALLGIEESGVGPRSEPIESLVRFEPGQAYADPDAHMVLEGPIDQVETTLDFIEVDPPSPHTNSSPP